MTLYVCRWRKLTLIITLSILNLGKLAIVILGPGILRTSMPYMSFFSFRSLQILPFTIKKKKKKKKKTMMG